MATPPSVSVPTTGTDPKATTLEDLETEISAGFAQAYDDLVQHDEIVDVTQAALADDPAAARESLGIPDLWFRGGTLSLTGISVVGDAITASTHPDFGYQDGVNGLRILINWPNVDPEIDLGSATIDVNGFGPLPITRRDGEPLEAGDLTVNDEYYLVARGGGVPQRFEVMETVRSEFGDLAFEDEVAITDTTGDLPISRIVPAPAQRLLGNLTDAEADPGWQGVSAVREFVGMPEAEDRLDRAERRIMAWSPGQEPTIVRVTESGTLKAKIPPLRVFGLGMSAIATSDTSSAMTVFDIPTDATEMKVYIDHASGTIQQSTDNSYRYDADDWTFVAILTQRGINPRQGVMVRDQDVEDALAASLRTEIRRAEQAVMAWSGDDAAAIRVYVSGGTRYVEFPPMRVKRSGVSAVLATFSEPVAVAVPADSTQTYIYLDLSDGEIKTTATPETAFNGEDVVYLGVATQRGFSNATGLELRNEEWVGELVAVETAARDSDVASLTADIADTARYHELPEPGVNPEAFSASRDGAAEELEPLTAAPATIEGIGTVHVLSEVGNVYHRHAMPLGSDVVRGTAVVRRKTDTPDPAGSTVRLIATFLDEDFAEVSSLSLLSMDDIWVSTGLVVMTGRVAKADLSGTTQAPSGAAYVRFGVRCFSDDQELGILRLGGDVVTDLHVLEEADLSQIIADAEAATTAAEAAAAGVAKVTLDSYAALRAYDPAAGVGEVVLRYGSSSDDGRGGTFALDVADTSSADDGQDTILDAQTPTAGRWKRVGTNIGAGFTRLTGRERVRTLEARFGLAVDVQDFSGVDPTGAGSSLAAVQAAVDEWKGMVANAEPTPGFLLFPPSPDGGEYVLDGSLDLTSLRGLRHAVWAHGAVIRGSGADEVTVDTTHSLALDWNGGTIIGDDTAPPAVGVQFARKLADGDNPSSHHHSVQNLTIAGEWTRACIYMYASEEFLAYRSTLRNEHDDGDAYCLVADGQSGVWTPTSEFQDMGFGTLKGFTNVHWKNCAFWRIDRLGTEPANPAPAVWLSRPYSHSFQDCLGQARGAPMYTLHHVAGNRSAMNLHISGRYETQDCTALLYLTGDDGAKHRGIDIVVDRMFPQRLIQADSNLSAGGVELRDVSVRIDDVFPPAASENPNGYAEVFANRDKIGTVTGIVRASNRHQDEGSFVAMEGLDIDLRGKLVVRDRREIGDLPDCTDGRLVIADDAHSGDGRFGTHVALADLLATGWRAAPGEIIDVQGTRWVGETGATHISQFPGLTPLGEGPDLYIASGAVTLTHAWHRIDTEGAASTDTLTDVNLPDWARDGQIFVLQIANNARTVTLEMGTGNLVGPGDVELTTTGNSWIGVRNGGSLLYVASTSGDDLMQGGISAAIPDLTDSTGGSTDGTLSAVSGSGADAAINNNFAEIWAALQPMLQALRERGVIES